jgi:hypothetical protein
MNRRWKAYPETSFRPALTGGVMGSRHEEDEGGQTPVEDAGKRSTKGTIGGHYGNLGLSGS